MTSASTPKAGPHVVVLAGGLSHERDVSVRSGRRVAEALHARGIDAYVRDADPGLLAWLRAEAPDCVVPLLHGESGEDGTLREILELASVAYVGSGATASRLAFDKPIAKEVVAHAGIRTPSSVTLPADTFREVGATVVMDAVVGRLGLPLAVKPAHGGSALGFSLVRNAEDLPAAMVACFAYGEVALIEQFVTGTEVAVGVIETARGLHPLPGRRDLRLHRPLYGRRHRVRRTGSAHRRGDRRVRTYGIGCAPGAPAARLLAIRSHR
jgi:D-alanine-D-alanine ligase